MAAVYSTEFISEQGASGTGTPVVVPTGYVFVVKFLSCFMAPLVGETRVIFKDFITGCAIWHQKVSQFETDSRQLEQAHIAFGPGGQFGFQVITTSPDAADVFASGYALTLP